MQMSSENLLVILIVGAVASWLAGQIVRGAGFGLVGNLVVGIVGAFFGSWLLLRLGVQLGTGMLNAIVNATVGAIFLLVIIRLFRGVAILAAGGAGAGAAGGGSIHGAVDTPRDQFSRQTSGAWLGALTTGWFGEGPQPRWRWLQVASPFVP